MFGRDVYPALEIKAAVLLVPIVRVDGNKRLGWAARVRCLRLSGVDLRVPDEAVGVIDGDSPEEVLGAITTQRARC